MTTLRTLAIMGVAVLLASCGTTTDRAGRAGDEPVETLVREFKATPINAGVHPDAFAYRVDATVLKGENPCVAGNSEVRFDRRREDETLVMTAMRAPVDPDRICTLEYNPVFEEMTVEVRGFRFDPDRVVIENVGEMGQHQTLW